MATFTSVTIPPTVAWTKKSDSQDVWIWVSGWFSTRDLSGLRAALELSATSGALSARLGYQTSNDQVNLNTPVALGSARTAEGQFVETSYTDVSTDANGALWIRFGVLVRNQTSGTTQELCRISGQIDAK